MERRSFPRIPVQLHTEIEITVDGLFRQDDPCRTAEAISCIVTSIDISLGGFSVKILHSPLDTSLSFSPALAYLLVGRQITAFFKDRDVTVLGKVVRVDPETMLMAVVITRVSDICRWREVCGEAIADHLID
jgi:hypothetical protein